MPLLSDGNITKETTTKNEINDSPHLCYPFDHPGLIFVPTPYSGDNFAAWKN